MAVNLLMLQKGLGWRNRERELEAKLRRGTFH